MKHNVIIEIDGVRHKLVKGSHVRCGECSIKEYCERGAEKNVFICFRLSGNMSYRFEKVKETKGGIKL
jgi:hypothetical protein